MQALIEMVASADFCLFILGVLGVALFTRVHKVIAKCDSKVFAIVCVVLAYFVITFIKH